MFRKTENGKKNKDEICFCQCKMLDQTKLKKQINADLLGVTPWWIQRSQRTRPEKSHT